MDEPKFKLRLRLTGANGVIMGPGRADLLALIAETGSIAAAGRHMSMSDRRAWSLVESLNSSFAAPLVETAKGGAGRGGARLTPLGQDLLAAYRRLEALLPATGQAELTAFEAALPEAEGNAGLVFEDRKGQGSALDPLGPEAPDPH